MWDASKRCLEVTPQQRRTRRLILLRGRRGPSAPCSPAHAGRLPVALISRPVVRRCVDLPDSDALVAFVQPHLPLGATIARPRFQAIAAALAAVDADHSITYGLAEADQAENLEHLIGRADGELLNTRRHAVS
jgi:hypothetical protein